MKIRYFDHAATTYVDKRVLDMMIPYFSENYGNPSSLYSIGKINKEIINLCRMKVANILNCSVNEIYFTSCGSESDNMIIKGIALANKNRGNHIITSQIEHPAVLETCKFLENLGFKITYIKPQKNGIIDPQDIRKNITKNTILISIMFANNEIGTIQPVKEIGMLAKSFGIYFHTDAVQAVGNINIDVKENNIDALSMSAHKFYGPKGIGCAYIKKQVPFVKFQDGGHQENNKRAGTENVAGIVGLTSALEIAQSEMNRNNKQIKYLRDYFFKEIINKIPYSLINGDIENRLPGNANILLKGVSGRNILEELDKKGICASSGSACSAGLLKPSHVLLALGMPVNYAQSSLRITFGKENTIEDTQFLIKSLEDIVKKLRN